MREASCSREGAAGQLAVEVNHTLVKVTFYPRASHGGFALAPGPSGGAIFRPSTR
jgi:hypothetical protein